MSTHKARLVHANASPDPDSEDGRRFKRVRGTILPEDFASEDNDCRVKAASKALETLSMVALERGCKNHKIFLEDSSGIYVVDADHPAWVK